VSGHGRTYHLLILPSLDHSPDAGTGLLSFIAYALHHVILLHRENPYWAPVAAAMHGFESYALQRGILLHPENPMYWAPVEAETRGFEALKHRCWR